MAFRKKSKFKIPDRRLVMAGIIAVMSLVVIAVMFRGDGALAGKGGKGGGGKGKDSATPTATPVPMPPLNSGELVTNGSFEVDEDGDKIPDGWVHHYEQPNRNSKRVCDLAHYGSCSFYIPGKKHTAIKQHIPIDLAAGKRVTISGWSKADRVTLDQGPSEGSYWVQAWIHYADGSTQYNFHSNFNTGTHDFEKAEKSLVLPRTVEGFTVFAKQAMDGNVWFDDVSLVVE